MDDDVLTQKYSRAIAKQLREEARALGLSLFFTGKPCKHGHVCDREVSSGSCRECVRLRRLLHPDPPRVRIVRPPGFQQRRGSPRRKCSVEQSREMRLASKRRYAAIQANRQKKLERARAYRAANPEKFREKAKADREANPEAARARIQNRRARRRAAEGRHTAEDVLRIHKAQKGKCALCREKVGAKYEVDHIVPLKSGGSNWPRNLQILCSGCNRKKNAKDPLDFSRELGLLL